MQKRTFKQQLTSALRWIGWVLLVQFILINICAAFYGYKLTHFYEKVDSESFDEANIFAKSWKIFSGPRYGKAPISDTPFFAHTEIKLQTASGLQIDGWYGKAGDSAKGTIILFHGISGNRDAMLDEATEFYRKGYNVMFSDFRAHGNSEGNTCTIAFRECEEVKLAYEYVKGKGEKNVFLYGSSMGAVAVARALYKYPEISPSGVILDMPFLSLHTFLKGKARVLGFPGEPFGLLTTFWISVERGYNGFDHNTSRYSKGIHCPVLYQWGTLDNFVLRDEIEKVYNSTASTNKKLVIYTNALHESFLRKDPMKWGIEIDHFLETNARRP